MFFLQWTILQLDLNLVFWNGGSACTSFVVKWARMIIKLLLEIVFTGFEIFKCHHANKLLLRNYKTNHWLQFPDSFAGFYAGVKRVSSWIVFTNKYTLFNHIQCIVSRQENVRHVTQQLHSSLSEVKATKPWHRQAKYEQKKLTIQSLLLICQRKQL